MVDSEKTESDYSETKKINLNFEILNNLEIIKSFWPFCLSSERNEENEIVINGNFSFQNEVNKNEFSYELILNDKNKYMEVKLSGNSNEKMFLKKMLNNLDILYSELLL